MKMIMIIIHKWVFNQYNKINKNNNNLKYFILQNKLDNKSNNKNNIKYVSKRKKMGELVLNCNSLEW